jgi:hypothetical protein
MLMEAVSIPAVLALGRALGNEPGAEAEAMPVALVNPTAAATLQATASLATASLATASSATAALAAAIVKPSATATVAATATARASTSAAPSSCAVRCNKRCSYPGQCRRYVDANKNKRCDLGECM